MAGLTGLTLLPGAGGATLGVDSDGTYVYEIVKIGYSVAGATPTEVSLSNPLPISLAAITIALPLPAGASTAARQAAPGAAGTPSADVTSVQGIAGMTPVKTDGSSAVQPVSGTVAVSGTLAATNDSQVLDDDGYPYVNPNVPGADIATGDRQNQQLAALQQIAAGAPVSQQGSWTVTVGSQPATALAPNAAQENTGQLQRVADLLEAVLVELKVISASIVQLGQPIQDGPDVLRDDINLQMQ